MTFQENYLIQIYRNVGNKKNLSGEEGRNLLLKIASSSDDVINRVRLEISEFVKTFP